MILGVHNMVDALSDYTKEHVTADGSLWILGLDGILLIPVVFAVFFYPIAMLVGIGGALVLAVAYLALVNVAHRHRTRIGH